MTGKPEPLWLTRDGAFKVIIEGSGNSSKIMVFSWSDDYGKAGGWVPILTTRSSDELSRHFPEGSLHEFEVPNFPPDGEAVAA